MTTLIHIIGYFIIFSAIDYKRKEDSKIIPWSKDHLITIFMVLVASLLINA
jgi:hypothetical protein